MKKTLRSPLLAEVDTNDDKAFDDEEEPPRPSPPPEPKDDDAEKETYPNHVYSGEFETVSEHPIGRIQTLVGPDHCRVIFQATCTDGTKEWVVCTRSKDECQRHRKNRSDKPLAPCGTYCVISLKHVGRMGWGRLGCIPVAGLKSSDEESPPHPWIGFSTT